MDNKTHEQWLADRATIAKGIQIGIEEVEQGKTSLGSMAYGVVQSLLTYDTTDPWFSDIFDLVGTLETAQVGEEKMFEKEFNELKRVITTLPK